MPEDNIKTEDIKKAIMRVIVFFDMFDYPVTEFEIWTYLSSCPSSFCHSRPRSRDSGISPLAGCDEGGNPFSLNDIKRVLSNKEFLNKNKIKTKQGFYYLSSISPLSSRTERSGDSGSIVKTRMNRYNHTDRKFKIALRVAKLFKFIPWIKMIAIGNMIGSNNLDNDGDIDLFIITKKDRAWISRAFCAGLMVLFNKRPKPGKEKDTICLSFFIDEKEINLEKIKISKDDIYFDHWFVGLKPIYDRDSTYKRFTEENKWIRDRYPNWEAHKSVYFRDSGNSFSKVYRDSIDMLFGGLNYKLKNAQIKVMPEVLRRMINKDKRVIVGDRILKLHVNDRREKIQKKYYSLLSSRGFDVTE